MKIVTINGSPKGAKSACHAMLSAFTKKLEDDFEVVSIRLADKRIENCRGCYACWANDRGCVINDDFKNIVSAAAGADLIVFASPVYFGNVSGLFKNFIDRLTSTGNPHAEVKMGAPKFVMLSNCGFPSPTEFEIISAWINRFTGRMKSELLGEYYYPNGKRLKEKDDADAAKYLQMLTEEGRRIVNLQNAADGL